MRPTTLSDISYPMFVEHTITRVISEFTGYKMFKKYLGPFNYYITLPGRGGSAECDKFKDHRRRPSHAESCRKEGNQADSGECGG